MENELQQDTKRHKRRLIFAWGSFFLLIVTMITIGITSQDVDEICDTDNMVLQRINGEWQCADKSNVFNSFYANGITCTSFGADALTGNDGDALRQMALTNYPMSVIVDASYLNLGHDYNTTIMVGNFTVTFFNNIWDEQRITLCEAVTNTTISNSIYLGSNASGLDGAKGRVLATNITNPTIVSVDNQQLNIGYDYNVSLTDITFSNEIFDEMVISVWG